MKERNLFYCTIFLLLYYYTVVQNVYGDLGISVIRMKNNHEVSISIVIKT